MPSWTSVAPATISATQAATSLMPTYTTSDGGAVVFDGVDDQLQFSTHLFAAGNTSQTVFAVYSGSDYSGHLMGTGASTAGRLTREGYGLGVAAGKAYFKALNNSGVWLLAPSSSFAMSPQVTGVKVSDTATELTTACHNLQGASPVPADLPTSTIGSAVTGNEAFSGGVHAMLIYNRVLTNEEFIEVRAYLASQYGAYVAPTVDTDSDGTFDACDTGAVYLASPTISVTLEEPETLWGGVAANIIDSPNATAFDPHTEASHVWAKGGVGMVMQIDLNGVYNIEQVHFWNFTGEGYDVDSVTLKFYSGADALLDELVIAAPQLGFERILAQDFAVNVSGVSYVRVEMSGTNGEAEFQNIGFSAVPVE